MSHEFSNAIDMTEDDIFKPNLISQVPPEILVRIFKLSQRHEPKRLSKLRFVCKQWRDVIDENFEMKIKIDDNKMSAENLHRFARVSNCIVSKFVRKVPQLKSFQLFKDPTLITTLNIRGYISRENFWLLAEQCQHITEFIFTGAMLNQETNMFELGKLQNFANRLKKLVVTGIYLLSCNTTTENLGDFLSIKMSNLTTLIIRASYPESFKDDTFLSFIKQCPLLETLDLTLNNYEFPSVMSESSIQIPNLTNLKFETRNDRQLDAWVPFIRAQINLKQLRLLVIEPNGIDLNLQVQQSILKNKQALEHLEIGLINDTLINTAVVFRGTENLKSLKILGKRQPTITNLNLLPMSIKTLDLNSVRCRESEFEEITSRVPNLVTRGIRFYR